MITKEEFNQAISLISFDTKINYTKNIALPKDIEASNDISWCFTDFPNKDRLSSLKNIAGWSSSANCYIINTICKHMSADETYMNVGVFKGLTMFAGIIDTKCKVIGIDNFSQFGGPREIFMENLNKFQREGVVFYDEDYKDVLKKNKEQINFYFYDGHHSYNNQYDAIVYANNFLNTDSVIMIDDTNNLDCYNATFDALRYLNREYDVWFDIKTSQNKHPSYWNGLLILGIK